LEPKMYAKAIERADHFTPSPTLTQDLEPPAVSIQPDRKSRLRWLRSAFDAVVRYVIGRQMAAARREIKRGKDRLSLGPDTD
jgi:hypothetical protein